MANEFKVKNGLIVDQGGATITGSVIATGGFTGSLLGTASFATSASYALTASYAMNGGASFPYTGSAIITGSLIVTGSTTSTLGFTGSLFGTASFAANGGVTQLLAGSNISLSPTTGVGQVTISSTAGGGGFNTATGSYGSFYDTTTQTNVAGTARSMSLNTTDITNGVSVSGSTNPFNTYIKVENAGVYNIQFSAQVDKTDSGTDEIWIWIRKNGTNLTDTATSVQLQGNGAHYVAAWNFFVNAAAGDYFQLMWYSPDANVRLHAESAFGVVPGIPSLIVTANRVDQFLSNTGSFSGSFTGSLFGTASWAINALTASYISPSLIFPYTGSALITGSLRVTGSTSIQGTLNQGSASLASGLFSHVQGFESTASGNYSHAEGYLTRAIGAYSHAEGSNSLAEADYSHAEGVGNAYGIFSHAEGESTLAIGQSSHAEGYGTITSGSYSHAEGNATITSGSYSHAEGNTTKAIGGASHAEGNETKTGITTAYASSVSSGVVTLNSTYGDVSGEFATDNNLLLYDTPFDNVYGKSIFIISQSYFSSPNTIVELVDISVTTTTAYVGDLGYGIANWGGDQTIPGNYSHTEGNSTIAIGDYSHAEGISTQAIGESSHAEGVGTQAIGNYSHAEGDSTKTIGAYSHAEGASTQAIGNYSHAEGYLTIATGDYSHAEGEDTKAIGNSSHAEGRRVSASGQWSHAEGISTIAIGVGSHAEGQGTQAIGNSSHAEGLGTVASGSYQHVQGQYNISSSAESAFIIGNGTSTSARSNLVFASGSQVQITGSLIVSGSSTFTNIGPAIFSGSVNSQGGFTGSLQGTASFALAVAGGGSTFPYVGNAVITGSLIVSGSGIGVTGSINATSITSSFTGSLTGALIGTASWAGDSLFAYSGKNSTSGGTLGKNVIVFTDGGNSFTSSQYLTIQGGASNIRVTVTGSANISGSLNLSGVPNTSAASLLVYNTSNGNVTYVLTSSITPSSASYALSASAATSSSYALTASFLPVGTYNITSSWAVSASQAISSSKATSASYALTASYAMNGGGGAAFPYVGAAVITGSLVVSGSTGGIDTINGTLTNPGSISKVDWISALLNTTAGVTTVDWENKALYDNASGVSIDWGNRLLYETSNAYEALNYSNSASVSSQLYYNNIIPAQVQRELANNPTYAGQTIQALISSSAVDYNLVALDTDGVWKPTNATVGYYADKMLGIAVDVAGGYVLIEGDIGVSDDNSQGVYVVGADYGLPVYVSTSNNQMTTTAPSSAGSIVRIVGHIYYNSSTDANWWTMKFRPSNDWYEI